MRLIRQQEFDGYCFLQELKGIAPDIKLKDAMLLASKITELKRRERELSNALLILAVDACEMDSNGYITNKDLIKIAKEKPRVLMALGQASYEEARWVCGICPGGLEGVLTGFDEEAEDLKSRGKLKDTMLKDEG